MSNQWIEVDKEGLKQVFPVKHVIRELIANMWDEMPHGAIEGTIRVIKVKEPDLYHVVSEDNSPKGFKDLTDSFTMFRYTDKRKNPEIRGRFNSGDKYVLAHSEYAEISSTTGTYKFNKEGTREFIDNETSEGSLLEFSIRFSSEDIEYIIKSLKTYKPPKGFELYIDIGGTVINLQSGHGYMNNEKLLPYVKPYETVEAVLPTWMIAENDSKQPISRRKTTIKIYKETKSYIYEMGIPVMEIDDPYSYDIQQKVPLDQNREVVSDKYLREVRGACLNALANDVDEEDISETWIMDALESKNISEEAFSDVVERKYPKSVLWSNNPRANERALEEGFNVIHPRTVPKQIRERMVSQEIVMRSSEAFPTGFEDADYIAPRQLTEGMKKYENFTREIGKLTINRRVTVDFIDNPHVDHAASYGDGRLTYNVGVLGKKWFTLPFEYNIDLILHELSHEFSERTEMPHKSVSYHDAFRTVVKRAFQALIRDPDLFDRDNY